MTRRTLVIGYGNVLRGDDGVGWQVAQAVADRELPGTDVLLVQQLTPELACDLSEADIAVLVDADRALAPGDWRLDDAPDERTMPLPEATAWSHHVGPRELLRLAHELYGHAPRLTIVRIGVASVEAGEGLTPAVRAAVPSIATAIVAHLDTRTPALAGATDA